MTDYVWIAGNRVGGVATLRKFDTAGAEITTGFPIDHTDHLFSVVEMPSGHIVFCGNRVGVSPNFITHRKYAIDGTFAFNADFGHTARCVYSDISNNIYVCGARGGTAGNYYGVRKYDSSGNVMWSALHSTVSADTLYAVAVDAQGSVYVVGNIVSGVSIRKFDNTGTPQWTANHGETVYCCAIDADGNLYTGGLSSVNSGGFSIRKYNSSGVLQWSRSTGAGKTVRALLVSSDGYLYVGQDGTTSNILKYFLNGNQDTAGWPKNWGGTVFGLASDSGGNIYAAGTNISSVSIRKFDSAGTQQWTATHGGTVNGIWVTRAFPAPANQSLNIPAIPLPLNVAVPSFSIGLRVPAIPLPLNIAAPSFQPRPSPPDFSGAGAKAYTLYITGGPSLLSLPIRSLQCERRLGKSTWLSVEIPYFDAALYNLLSVSGLSEIVIYASVENGASGEFLRAVLTEKEGSIAVAVSSITLVGRVKTPSYTQASRDLRGVATRGEDAGKRLATCDIDPALRPNDTANDGINSFVVGAISYSITPEAAVMKIREA